MMRPPQRRHIAAAVGLLLGVGLLYRVSTRPLPIMSPAGERHVVGAFHLHSKDSHDSEIALETYTEAAHAAGLDFIILTDHNSQRTHVVSNDVTVLSYAELSTGFGHVVGLGGQRLLEREERDSPAIHQAFRQAGGIGIVTHPTDLKRPWTGPWKEAGGLEIANLAASARRQAGPLFVGLLPQLITWGLNRPLTLAQIYDRDDSALAQWDALADPAVIGMCGNDAHGWIDVGLNVQGWILVLDAPAPAGDGRAATVLEALHRGRFHCVAGIFGRDPDFRFGARRGADWVAEPGDTIGRERVDQLVIRSPSSNLAVNQIVLLRDGSEVTRTLGNSLVYADPQPGTYRAEIRALVPRTVLGARWLPVVYSNRIRILPAPAPAPGPVVP